MHTFQAVRNHFLEVGNLLAQHHASHQHTDLLALHHEPVHLRRLQRPRRSRVFKPVGIRPCCLRTFRGSSEKGTHNTRRSSSNATATKRMHAWSKFKMGQEPWQGGGARHVGGMPGQKRRGANLSCFYIPLALIVSVLDDLRATIDWCRRSIRYLRISERIDAIAFTPPECSALEHHSW